MATSFYQCHGFKVNFFPLLLLHLSKCSKPVIFLSLTLGLGWNM